MSWSLGEIKALSLKAARGAGLDWGEAEELAFSVDWLNRNSLSGVTYLADYLEWRSDGSRYDKVQDPVPALCQISDLANCYAPFPGHYYQPLLLVPAIAQTVEHNQVMLKYANTEVIISSAACSVSGEFDLLSGTAELCNLGPSEQSFPVRTLASRAPEEMRDGVTVLERFAAKTYAPSTQTSRSAGAGAGNDGND